MNRTILLVDDDPHVLSGLSRVLRREAYRILTASGAEEAAGLLETCAIDLIVCDEEMPGMCGTAFLARVAEKHPDMIRIMLTGRPSLDTAMRAINEGKVYHFFTKPCNEIDLAITIRRALEHRELLEKARHLLEVAREQTMLIDEARIVRRLRVDAPPDRSAAACRGRPAREGRQVLEEMDEAIRRGKEVLSRSANADPVACDPPCDGPPGQSGVPPVGARREGTRPIVEPHAAT